MESAYAPRIGVELCFRSVVDSGPMLLNALYLFVLTLLSPWLVWRAWRTGRYRNGLAAKLLGRVEVPLFPRPLGGRVRVGGKPPADGSGPLPLHTHSTPHPNPPPQGAREQEIAWFHGVSVGEIHLLTTVVAAFRKRHPAFHCVISSTTDTGLAEARARFADCTVIAWPFDFSWAVANALDAVKPSLVVLAEGEMWPNFLAAAKRRNIPVAVINARLSPRSFGRYRRIAGLARRLFLNRVDVIAVQSADYAERFQQLGVNHLRVTGSIKYDGAIGDRDTPKGRELARLLLKPGDTVLVAGSTHAPEESLILDAFRQLRERFPALRLLLVPRHPDRFAEVAVLLAGSDLPFVRRSQVTEPLAETPPVVLLDTVGELGAAWGLADVGYVGGTLDGKRGGQSMIEPAGYGVPTVFGPHVWNFRDAARRLVEVGGAVMVKDAAGLVPAFTALLEDTAKRTAMGTTARQFVRDQQGATAKTLDVLDELIDHERPPRQAA
ncbi:3-deoxy-D-manno-octulosonic acid transferase [Limnoglobus roseus]|uniref:3-deoxy-D-manno-octulosonic acid transferase n=1 Tax=Limnoglobus roseus TaxID=2598579 RepID=A0A5C1AC64_9BACT|nr:3-deoxy-D-manno-octulosonic acid transferase [Limnoglobus roseus]QEL15787.1 3-deoxy-D-manno-octulosonic acid transferase [Limnoglobus roseus]